MEDGCLDGRTEILNIESNTLCATSYLPNKIKFKTPLSTVRLEYLLLDFFNWQLKKPTNQIKTLHSIVKVLTRINGLMVMILLRN